MRDERLDHHDAGQRDGPIESQDFQAVVADAISKMLRSEENRKFYADRFLENAIQSALNITEEQLKQIIRSHDDILFRQEFEYPKPRKKHKSPGIDSLIRAIDTSAKRLSRSSKIHRALKNQLLKDGPSDELSLRVIRFSLRMMRDAGILGLAWGRLNALKPPHRNGSTTGIYKELVCDHLEKSADEINEMLSSPLDERDARRIWSQVQGVHHRMVRRQVRSIDAETGD